MSELKKQMIINNYKKALEYMMTDLDFKRYFGLDVPIIKYSELSNYNNMEELLPNDKDFKIVLTESDFNSGHWCCIMRYNNNIEWFDSYGVHPEGQLSFIPLQVKQMLGQNKHHLTRLLKTLKPNQKIIFNNKALQVLKDGVNTCGRWVVARILTMRIGYTLPDFLNLLKNKKKETGKPYDILITDWIK
jgi:hypothetical protein